MKVSNIKSACGVCNEFKQPVATSKVYKYTMRKGIFRKRYVDYYDIKPICEDCVNELLERSKNE